MVVDRCALPFFKKTVLSAVFAATKKTVQYSTARRIPKA
jgi:hypothetical protein